MKKEFLIVNMFLVAGAYLFTGSLLIAMVAGLGAVGIEALVILCARKD